MRQKKISDIFDSLYKQKMIDYYDTLIEASKPTVEVETPTGKAKLSRKEFLDWYKTASKDNRTALIKNYEYAKSQGYKGTLSDFRSDLKTVHQKDYEYYVEQEKAEGRKPRSFEKWMLDVQKSGGLSIEDLISRKKALAEVEAQNYFKNPKWVDDLEGYIKSKPVQDKIFLSDNPELETAREKVRYIEDKIKSGNGKILEVKWADDKEKTMVWTVQWPSGDIEEIKHGVRD